MVVYQLINLITSILAFDLSYDMNSTLRFPLALAVVKLADLLDKFANTKARAARLM